MIVYLAGLISGTYITITYKQELHVYLAGLISGLIAAALH